MTSRIAMGAVALLAGFLAGCSSTGEPAGVDGLAKNDQIGEAAVGFAGCMRDNGYPMSDPTYNDEGLPVFGGDLGGVPKDARFEEVRRTCMGPLTEAYRAAGISNAKDVKPEELLGFARCMREHGIDVADPTVENPLVIPTNAYNSPAWEPAKQACVSLLPETWRPVLDTPKNLEQKRGGTK